MLELIRGINPTAEHVVGDMRSFRLERTLNAVFVGARWGPEESQGPPRFLAQ